VKVNSVSVVKAAWNHLCVTWTRLTGFVSVYVNATLVLDVHQSTITRVMHDGATLRLGESCCFIKTVKKGKGVDLHSA